MDETLSVWDESILTIEPFVGHRVWRLVPRHGEPVLAAVTSGDPWLGGEIEAECFAGGLLVPRERRPTATAHPGESPPVLGCTCGLYASKAPVAPPSRRVWASGMVRLWGRVIEGTKGFRAERARIQGDVDVFLGAPASRCSAPACRETAVGVYSGTTSFVARCGRHDRGRSVPLDVFAARVDGAFRHRYGVGASLAGH